jgi:DNA-binding transcriptional LysR family regulator
MRRYTLRQLDTFMEVARESSVSLAAQKLHITQPAVSMQLRQLEQALGAPLVESEGRSIRLTAAGLECERLGRLVMAQLKEFDDAFAARRTLRGGRVDLAVVSTAKYFVPMLLVAFRRKHPGVEVKLTLHNREGVLDLLARNECDLVVMGRAPDQPPCDAHPFASNPMGIVASPSHPMSRRKRAPLSMLKGQDFVTREEGSGTRAAMERVFAKARVKPQVVMEMPSNETIKQAVMAGMGVSFLSLHTIGLELKTGLMHIVDVEGTPVMRAWHVVHLQSKVLSPAAEAFRYFILEEGEAHLAAHDAPLLGR